MTKEIANSNHRLITSLAHSAIYFASSRWKALPKKRKRDTNFTVKTNRTFKYNYIALIPARKGSKRIVGKNTIDVGGKPLIQHTFDFIEKTHFFSSAVCSTNDDNVATLAAKTKGIHCRIRPEEICQDHSSDNDVIGDAIRYLKISPESLKNTVFVYLRPTSPFRTAKELQYLVTKMESGSFSSVRSVVKATGVHHPYWMYNMNQNGIAEPFIHGISVKNYYQSQLLPPAYRLTGTYDMFLGSNLEKFGDLYGPVMSVVEISDASAIDIDTKTDLDYAEFLFSKGLKP